MPGQQKMTWDEIKKEYPDCWVSLDQIETEENGQVISGIVTASGPDLGSVTKVAKKQRESFTNHKFEFTGRIRPYLGVARWSLKDAHAD